MRFRSKAAKQRTLLYAGLGLAGAVILFVSLPSWVLLALIGASLIAGAVIGYKSGF